MKLCFTVLTICVTLFISRISYSQTQVTFFTTEGDFVVELYDSIVPITAGNFIGLVNDQFYDGIIFHRVIDGFMIQGGDPTGTGSGGSGVVIPDEFDSTLSNIQRTISMANSGPNTGTSQFFINLVNNTYLDFDNAPLSSAHPVFGIVVTGFDIVQQIGQVPTNGSDRPLQDVIMDSLRVTYDPFSSISEPVRGDLPINIFPTLLNESLSFQIESPQNMDVTIAIYDAAGKLCYNQQKQLTYGINTVTAQEPGNFSFVPGSYYVVVTQHSLSYTRKVVLTR